MKTPALIRNPRSLRNRRLVQDPSDFARAWLGENYLQPNSAEATAQALRDLAARGVDWLIVDGGDGTVREVLTALPQAFPHGLPRISIVPSGNTNVIAADVGMSIRGPDALSALRAAAEQGRGEVNSRPCLEVRRTDLPVLRGMFFGAGIYRRATEMAQKSIYHDRLWHGPAVAAAITAAVFQILAGRKDGPWRVGEAMQVRAGDDPVRGGRHFLVLATTLRRLILGIWPFWNESRGPIQFLDVDAPTSRLTRVLWSLLRGRSPQWIRDSGTYRSHGVEGLHIQLQAAFILDGEAYEPGPDGIWLAAGPTIDYFRA